MHIQVSVSYHPPKQIEFKEVRDLMFKMFCKHPWYKCTFTIILLKYFFNCVIVWK